MNYHKPEIEDITQIKANEIVDIPWVLPLPVLP